MVVIEMEVKCPVAKCDYTVRGSRDGFKHFQNYDDLHKKLHWNWLKYFYPDLAKSDMPDTVKFRIAYRKWHENEKKQKIQAQKQKKKGQDTPSNITMKDGKVIYNGEEYTPEQFANIQKGIQYMPVKMNDKAIEDYKQGKYKQGTVKDLLKDLDR